MEAMKFLLVSALVLSVVCLTLALFHWVRLRRDLNVGDFWKSIPLRARGGVPWM